MLNWLNKRMKKRKGFTLVELVVVIAILGILAGIAVPKLSKSRENAAIAAHIANVRTLESAATLAVSEGIEFGNATSITWEENDETKWEDYLQSWPKVPIGLEGKTIGKDEESKDITIGANPVYTVIIDTNGGIKVEPGKPIE